MPSEANESTDNAQLYLVAFCVATPIVILFLITLGYFFLKRHPSYTQNVFQEANKDRERAEKLESEEGRQYLYTQQQSLSKAKGKIHLQSSSELDHLIRMKAAAVSVQIYENGDGSPISGGSRSGSSSSGKVMSEGFGSVRSIRSLQALVDRIEKSSSAAHAQL
jgi:hypothetical protein